MSLGDPITPEDIEDIRKRWAALRTPSGDSAITVARIDIRLLLTQLDDANSRIARMQREPAYREDAFEFVERELREADISNVTVCSDGRIIADLRGGSYRGTKCTTLLEAIKAARGGAR